MFLSRSALKRLDQLLHGTREAVKLPNNDSIPRPRKFERVAEHIFRFSKCVTYARASLFAALL